MWREEKRKSSAERSRSHQRGDEEEGPGLKKVAKHYPGAHILFVSATVETLMV